MSNVLNEEKKQQVIALGRLRRALAAHRAGYRCASRNGGSLPEGSRYRGPRAGWVGPVDPLSTTQLLARSARAGTHIGAFCEAIHQSQGELGVRRILGVLSLAKKYGVATVDDACSAALELGVHEYRFGKGISLALANKVRSVQAAAAGNPKRRDSHSGAWTWQRRAHISHRPDGRFF